MKKSRRPLVFFIFAWTLGVIGGTLYEKNIQGSLLFCIFIVIGLVGCYGYLGKKQLQLFLSAFLIGVIMLLMHPTTRYVGKLETGKRVCLKGTVAEIQTTDYGKNLTLSHVTLEAAPHFKGKIQLQVDLSQKAFAGERLQVTGEVVAFPTSMNPSDFDYGQYLKGKNIVAVIKAKSCESLGGKPYLLARLRDNLTEKLDNIFEGKDEGIMQAALLGDDEVLEADTQNLYSAAGIGHILSVSGFHMGLIVSFLLGCSAYVGLPYVKRYIFIIGGIWSYAILTGFAVSTVRAAIMSTIVMLARILWEEEDFCVSIGLSAFLILMWQPYSIYSMGFQLSYIAVIAIGISQIFLKKWKESLMGFKGKLMKVIIPWLIITLMTSPIIAFWCYEIPLLSSVLNLIILPLFSLLIILGWCILGLYIIGIPFIWPLTKGIIVILQGVHKICEFATQMPLGTICTGKPSIIILIGYYMLLTIIGMRIYGIKFSKKTYGIIYGMICMGLGSILFIPRLLEITYLYVGQGDGAVIETPHKQMIVIDGGPAGKGKVIERYIKYKGKEEVAVLMLSHSDSDHISGIIEMVESSLKIKRVLVSKTDDSELLDTLVRACDKRNIPVIDLGRADKFQIDDVSFDILAPQTKQSDINNNSLVCLTTYKNFKALFTGDKEKESESNIYNEIGPISLLKVSHHGSKTGTEEKLLLKLQPQYAMISCGINNLYGHPHEEVLDALETCQVPYGRTDLQGAYWVRTNGEKMTLYTQKERSREEE